MLRSLIGRGGSSEVYAAEHRFLGDRVALKLLTTDAVSDDAASDAFVAEATKTRSIVHPNVVRVLDCGRDATTGRGYLVLEHVEGESLAARLERVGRLDEPTARRLFTAICDGMRAVHACGIVHRDLKPGNVMLSGDDPKIVDFGIATGFGVAARIGTPAYMAPEQLTGGAITPAVDIWALGVMLFETVTGHLPFAAVGDGHYAQLHDRAPRAGTGSRALDDLVQRCLARDPGARPASMAELARALQDDPQVGERARARDPVDRITQDVPPPVRIAPRRARWPAFAIGAAALGLVVPLVWVALSEPGASPNPAPPRPIATAPVDALGAAPQPIATAPVDALVAAVIEAMPAVTEPPASSAGFEVEIRSAPSGAEVIVAGRSLGTTPLKVPLRGSTAILVRRVGYRSSRITATKPGALDVRLVPVRRPARGSASRETLD